MPDVFLPGNLIRIKDFQFDNGNSRDKYLFVLFRNDDQAYVISSFTTSQNKFTFSATKCGCYWDPRISTYYHFPAGEIVGNGNFYFDKETYIFFSQNVHRIDLTALAHYISPTDPFAVVLITTLLSEELKKLLQCVLNSRFIPENLKLELAAFEASL